MSIKREIHLILFIYYYFKSSLISVSDNFL